MRVHTQFMPLRYPCRRLPCCPHCQKSKGRILGCVLGSSLGKDLGGVDVALSIFHNADANLCPGTENVLPVTGG